jgi:DNA-binding response OmpR family regulator
MRRIPVVDDDLHIRLAIRAWLKQYGFRVARRSDAVTRVREGSAYRLNCQRCRAICLCRPAAGCGSYVHQNLRPNQE